ncbi:MAG: AAA family ATPase [Pseudomonadota bacterium]
MKDIQRFLKEYGLEEAKKNRQMVFICGPRQTGKTTLAREFLKEMDCQDLYFNWDISKTRQMFREDPTFFENIARDRERKITFITFDEIHKGRDWKDRLKGFFDQFENEFHFIIIGSARLDMLRKKGESLSGRFFLYNLLPLALSECENMDLNKLWLIDRESLKNPFSSMMDLCTHKNEKSSYKDLFNLSGFPEPFTKGEESFHNKWQHSYVDLVFEQDLKDLTSVKDIDGLEHLLNLLPLRVGRPLSVNSIREDLKVAHETVSNWLRILEKLYLTFPLSPYSKKIARSIRKEKKWYFYDWTRVKEPSFRFENMLAVSLLRAAKCWEQMGLFKCKIQYIRTIEKKEVDFLILIDSKPFALVEAKLSQTDIDSHVLKLAKHLGNIPIFQVVHQSGIFKKREEDSSIISADRFLLNLP